MNRNKSTGYSPAYSYYRIACFLLLAITAFAVSPCWGQALTCDGNKAEFENFSPGNDGWYVYDHAPGGGFNWNNTDTGDCPFGNFTGGSGKALCAMSFSHPWWPYDTRVETSNINLLGVTSATLKYKANYIWHSQDYFDLEISTDGGNNWTVLQSWHENHGTSFSTPGEEVSISLTPYLGYDKVRLRWRYYNLSASPWNWYAQIDDVWLDCEGGADVSFKHSFSKNPVAENSDLTYQMKVTNNGPALAHDIGVATLFPKAFEINSASSTKGAFYVQYYALSGLAPLLTVGESFEMKAELTAKLEREALLTAISPSQLAGEFTTAAAQFGPVLEVGKPLTGSVATVDDGLAPVTDGCEGVQNLANVIGKIALLDEGTCEFPIAIRNAQGAGAIAAIVTNDALNTEGVSTMFAFPETLASDITIPAVRISYDDGNKIKAALLGGYTVNVSMEGVEAVSQTAKTLAQVRAKQFDHVGSNNVSQLELNVLKDSDGDGTGDALDGCPADPLKSQPGQCGCGNKDTDSDGDGSANCIDQCPSDPGKTVPGVCGCGIKDTDSDGDGSADCIDQCPSDPGKTAPGTCGCGIADADTNGNGVLDCLSTAELAASIPNVISLIKKLRPLRLTESKRKNKKRKARLRELKQQLRTMIEVVATLIQENKARIKLQDASTNLDTLLAKCQKTAKKAMRTQSSAFRRNKKKALRAFRKLLGALAA